MFELTIGRRWLFGLHLSHLPSTRHRHERSLLELDRFEWLGCVGFSVGRRIGVEDPCKVGCSFSSRQNRERESAKLCEEWQCRHDVRNAAGLSWAIGSEPVQYGISRNAVIVAASRVKTIPWVCAKNVVFNGIPSRIKHDPVHGDCGKPVEIGRRDLVCLDEAEVELDLRIEARIVREDCERFAIRGACHPHRAEFLSEMHRASPHHECLLDATIGFRVASEHLQPGAGTHYVMREGQDDPPSIRVVGRFITSTVPKNPSNSGAIGCVGRKPIRIGPMASIIVSGYRSVIACAHNPRNASCLRRSTLW